MIRISATRLLRYKIPPNQLTTNNVRNRCLATASQKRSLNEKQISGKSNDATNSAAKGSASTHQPRPSGGGLLLPLFVLAATAGGGAYYMDLIPKDLLPEALQGEEVGKTKQPSLASALPKTGETEKEQISVKKEIEEAPSPIEKDQKSESVIVEKSKRNVEIPNKEAVTERVGHRVTQIHTPPKNTERIISPPPPVQHSVNAHKVTMESFACADAPTKYIIPEEKELATVNKAEAEMGITEEKSKTDVELAKAHESIRKNLDETLFKDLDSLTYSQLRIRVVQLASEMQDRTKWEAVRLKEFLKMKEKEVNESYVAKMQNQRLEFEDSLARHLREQEDRLVKETNAKLQAKEESFQSIIDAATKTQEAAHEETINSLTDRLEREISAKAEAEFGLKLAEEKAAFLKELEKKTASVEELAGKMKQTTDLLKISRNFEDGSQRAHRVSAAALAFAEKMETSKSAGEELAALKAAAFESEVIESALSKIPNSVRSGVPTLSELQTSYETIHNSGRQAAHVPIGRKGLEGQLAGMLFATLTSPPSPDSLPPESDSAMAEYALVRARGHVRLGNLEEAVNELNKLKGQTAYTMRDWKNIANDRIAVEKVMKIIKMECALMNKNMGG